MGAICLCAVGGSGLVPGDTPITDVDCIPVKFDSKMDWGERELKWVFIMSLENIISPKTVVDLSQHNWYVHPFSIHIQQ